MADQTVTMTLDLAWSNPKVFRALRSLITNLESLAEDFEYRPEIPKAIKAVKFLMKNVEAVESKNAR